MRTNKNAIGDHFLASLALNWRYVITPKNFRVAMAMRQTIDWIAKRKKLRLKWWPETTYLLVVVIKIDDAQ